MEISNNKVKLTLSLEEVEHIYVHDLLPCIEGLLISMNKTTNSGVTELDYDSLVQLLEDTIYSDTDYNTDLDTEDDQYINELFSNLIDNDSFDRE